MGPRRYPPQVNPALAALTNAPGIIGIAARNAARNVSVQPSGPPPVPMAPPPLPLLAAMGGMRANQPSTISGPVPPPMVGQFMPGIAQGWSGMSPADRFAALQASAAGAAGAAPGPMTGPVAAAGRIGVGPLVPWVGEMAGAMSAVKDQPTEPRTYLGVLGAAIPPFARPALQKPQRQVDLWQADQAYKIAKDQVGLADVFKQAAIDPLGGVLAEPGINADMLEWADKDENHPTIVNAFEKGYAVHNQQGQVVEVFGPGNAAVVAAFYVSLGQGLPGFLREFAHGTGTDPYVWAIPLQKAGAALETSGRMSAAERGGAGAATAADTRRILAGQGIQIPFEVANVVGGLPFEVAGGIAGDIRARIPAFNRALSPSEQTLRQEQTAQTEDLFDIGSTIPPDTTPGAAAATAGTPPRPDAGAPGAAAVPAEAVPAEGPVTDYTVVEMGPKDYQVIDPATGGVIRGKTGRPLTFTTHRMASADAARRTAQDALNINTTPPADIAGPVKAPLTTEPTIPAGGTIAEPAEMVPPLTEPTLTVPPTPPIVPEPAAAAAVPVPSPADIAGPVTPTGILKDHWLNPEGPAGRKTPYLDAAGNPTRKPSVPEFMTYDLGPLDRAMGDAWWHEVEKDPRTQAFVDEQATFDRQPSPYGAGASGAARESAEKILSQARHEVDVQRQHMQDLLGDVPTDHVFTQGDALHPGIAAVEQGGGKRGARYPKISAAERGPAERNAVERAIFGTDEDASAARQYLHVLEASGTEAQKQRAARLLAGIEELRTTRKAQDGLTGERTPLSQEIQANGAEPITAPVVTPGKTAVVGTTANGPERIPEVGTVGAEAAAPVPPPEVTNAAAAAEPALPPETPTTGGQASRPVSAAGPSPTATVAAEGIKGIFRDIPELRGDDLIVRAVAEDGDRAIAEFAARHAGKPWLEAVLVRIRALRDAVVAAARAATDPSLHAVHPALRRMMGTLSDAVPDSLRADVAELPADIAAVTDTSTLGQAANRGEIGAEHYADLNRQLTVGGKAMRFLDIIHQAHADNPTSVADALDQVRFNVARADGITAAEKGRLLQRLGREFSSMYRENVMFNVFTGPRGIGADQIGDMTTMAVMGHKDAALQSLSPLNWRRWLRSQRGDVTALERTPQAQNLNAFGQKVPRDLMDAMHRADTDVTGEMKLTALAKKSPVGGGVLSKITPIFANKLIRDLRTAMDHNRRLTLLWTVFEKQIPEARATLVGLARREGGDALANAVKALPEQFSPTDVLNATGSENLARHWRGLTNDAMKAADAEQNRVLLSYRMTNLDQKLKFAVMFHYWLSRSAILHSKAALQNPALLNAYMRGFDGLKQKAEEEGLPGPLKTYFKFMGDLGGWYSVMDPIGAVLPYAMARDAFSGGNDDKERTFDKLVRRSGLFLTPWVEAAATMVGLSDQIPDPTATWSVRGYAKTFLDYARNNGLDLFGQGPGITEDPLARAERAFFSTVSDLADKSGAMPFARKVGFFDPAANESTQVLDVLKTQMEAEYGPLDGWDEAKRNEFLAAQVAIQSQSGDNERANAALAEWSAGKAGGKVAGLVVPGGVQTKYGPRDERIALKNAGYAGLDTGVQPTPEQQNAITATQQINASGPEAAQAETQQDLYGKLGTDREQQIAKNWNLMAYGDVADFVAVRGPNDTGVRTSTGLMSILDYVALPQEQRFAEADAYLERNGLTAEHDTIKTAQAAFKDTNPVYKGYAEFQKMMRDYPDGIAAARDQLMRANPAYRRYIGRLRPDVKADPKQFERASISMDAFLATRGVKGSVYAEDLGGNTTAWANTEFMLNALGGSGGAKKQYDLTTPAGRLAQLNDRLAEYEADMKIYNGQVRTLTNGIDFEFLPPEFQGLIARQLEARGVTKPGEPQIVSNYTTWKQAQPDPDAAITANYVKWMDQMTKAGEQAAA